jgi:DNA-binding MarR family transcriptional regulator
VRVAELTESALLQLARERLAELLPAHFELGDAVIDNQGPVEPPDALWQLREQNSGYGLILVEAKRSLTPRSVTELRDRLTGPVRRLMREATVLVVAPWIGPRARVLLDEAGYSYLDLTGNVRFRIDRPAVYVRLQGADRDPDTHPRSQARLIGPKARRLVRLLADASPPHRAVDLARAGGLTPGYVSKILESLDDQALIERDRRGEVRSVDWAALLSLGSARYDVLRNNGTAMFVAQEGAPTLYTRMLGDAAAPDVVVTGSFAASHIAKVAAPTQLLMYVEDATAMRQYGRLLPTDRLPDVVLLEPEDDAQLAASRTIGEIQHVELSQLVLDCLGGNGRLPEEGQAVLEWMQAHESEWRVPQLPVLTPEGNR